MEQEEVERIEKIRERKKLLWQVPLTLTILFIVICAINSSSYDEGLWESDSNTCKIKYEIYKSVKDCDSVVYNMNYENHQEICYNIHSNCNIKLERSEGQFIEAVVVDSSNTLIIPIDDFWYDIKYQAIFNRYFHTIDSLQELERERIDKERTEHIINIIKE